MQLVHKTWEDSAKPLGAAIDTAKGGFITTAFFTLSGIVPGLSPENTTLVNDLF